SIVNRFTPSPDNQGQPTTFLTGRRTKVFSNTFTSGKELVWHLALNDAKATKDSKRCQVSQCPGGCDDNNPCTADACTNGQCTHTAVANGTSCSDGNACNGAETCQSGTCKPGTAPNCNDNNPCTTDSCTATGGCTHAAVANGTSCSDGNACNG